MMHESDDLESKEETFSSLFTAVRSAGHTPDHYRVWTVLKSVGGSRQKDSFSGNSLTVAVVQTRDLAETRDQT